MIVQVRLISNGEVVALQQISDDAGSIQCENLANNLLDTTAHDRTDCYWVAVERDMQTARHKGDFS